MRFTDEVVCSQLGQTVAALTDFAVRRCRLVRNSTRKELYDNPELDEAISGGAGHRFQIFRMSVHSSTGTWRMISFTKINKRPAALARCANVQDIAQTFQCARTNEMPLSVLRSI